VSITLWHPGRRIGGMCHFLLPQRQRKLGEPLDGRTATRRWRPWSTSCRAGHPAVGVRGPPVRRRRHHARRQRLKFNVGERNIEQGWTLIDHYGFQLDGVDVGEDVPRTVALTWAPARSTCAAAAARRRSNLACAPAVAEDPKDPAMATPR
jgi:chemotaxis protein CheD